MDANRPRRPRDIVVRQPRTDQLEPTVAEQLPYRHPQRIFTTPFILATGFALFILVTALLLLLPVSNTTDEFTAFDTAFFTATSAVTVTGHIVVNTSSYWSTFGQVVIFTSMLVGGLSFMAIATFILALIGQRSSLSERLMIREAMGIDRLIGLRKIARNIVLIALLVYIVGAICIFSRIQGLDEMGFLESAWQSLFLSVSAFNNAGFSILPDTIGEPGLHRIASDSYLLGFVMVLIVLGCIGWTVLVDIYKERRFSRFSLNTKLVIVTTTALYIFGAAVFFLAELSHTMLDVNLWDKLVSASFHSISGRTAGFSTVDFSETGDFTKLVYPALMFIGGASGSVAGGIKVNTFAVIIAVVISSIRSRPRAEAFGREIANAQVLRAITVAVLGVVFLLLIVPTLTITDPDIPFLNLLFDTVSAFSTNGTSTGIVPDLSIPGKIIFMLAMFIGRLGPLTLALALVPSEHTLYRFAQERVTIG